MPIDLAGREPLHGRASRLGHCVPSGTSRNRLSRWLLGATAGMVLLAGFPVSALAQAQDRVGVRVGNHPDFGRVVFDWPGPVEYTVEVSAGRVTLRFAAPAAFDLSRASRPPRNMRGVTADGASVAIDLAPGAGHRHFRLGNRVVLDATDAAAASRPARVGAAPVAPQRIRATAPPIASPAARPAPASPSPIAQPAAAPPAPSAAPTPAPPAVRQAAPVVAASDRPGTVRTRTALPAGTPFGPASPRPAEAPVVVQAAPRVAVRAETLDAPVAAAPEALAPETVTPAMVAAPVQAATAAPPAAPRPTAIRLLPGPTIAIPAAAEIGAALFRRGGLWLLVLDAPLPLDLGALRASPALAGAETSSGPQATTLRLPIAAMPSPRLRREGGAWLLDQPAEPMAMRGIVPEVDAGPPPRLALRAAAAGGSVSVLDPETGSTLLVGTLRDGAGAVLVGHRAAIFELLPTRLGVALLPRADTVTLQAVSGRFLASVAAGGDLALGAELPGAGAAIAAAAGMSRTFDLPPEAIPALQERARNATAAVASAAPLSRGMPRIQTAEALLALGLPQEAQAMVTLATREDPSLAANPRSRALAGATALLGGRLAEATGLDDSRLPVTDEVALWRALLASARGENAAAAVAAGLPLLLSYPEPLLARLAPLAAEALAAGGEPAAARRVLAARERDDPPLALARARVLEAEQNLDAALAAYDAIAAGRDRRARAIAMRRAAELRLANGLLDAAGAAAALEATLAAWRGDALETEGRSRLAELRGQAGDWRGAFDLLRETAQAFPDLAAGLRERQIEALLGALDHEPPVAAVALYDLHADLLPPGPATEQALGSLADRLAALDLLDRAVHVLRGAVERAPDSESRARIGVRLAGLSLGAGESEAALRTLTDTAAAGLSSGLVAQRRLVEARALAAAGRMAEAVTRYREAGAPAAAELAMLLEGAQDWAGAAAALRLHLSTLAPAPTPLSAEDQPLFTRLAALLTLAGDDVGLAALKEEESARMMEGPLTGTFGLLTADRVAALSDLPRLTQELDVARGLPAKLDGLRDETPQTR